MKKSLVAACATLALALTLSSAWASPYEEECSRLAAGKGNDARRLHALFGAAWKHAMDEAPEDATFVGYPGQRMDWTDLSLEAIERRHREARAPLAVLRTIRRATLGAEDRFDYDLFKRNTEIDVEGTRYPDELFAISQLGGPQQVIAEIIALMPHENVKDYERILERLSRAPRLVDQTVALLQEGVRRGITLPKITLRDVPDQVKAMLDEDPAKNAMLVPFRDFPRDMPGTEQDRLRAAATRILHESLAPAFARLHDYLVKSYIPAARETIGLSSLPQGADWYAYRARYSTTTKLSPKEIHQIGLREVARIRKEMDKVMAEAGFKGSFEEFKEFLRTDSRFFYDSREELLRGYRDIAKRIDPELIRLFGKLPRLPYGVKPVPPYAEKSQTTAYYEPGAPDAGRAGNFMANTYALNTRPKWEMEALTLHEAVPGHHLQIALAQEMTGVPEFRKHGFYTSFIEGWGLYAESLGYDIGLYADPYSKFGQLTYEMWRAVRLVVDTGMHSLGWSRQQAIDFFKENTSKTEHDITVEVDRYIVWPGQALAYKIGQLKIKELRDRAKAALGERFDVRAFHDLVLSHGALPLDMLEQIADDWMRHPKK